MAYDPMSKFYDPQSDYSQILRYQISQGAPKEQIAETLQMRNNKAAATPGLEQYLYDDVYKQTIDYLSTGNVGPALQPTTYAAQYTPLAPTTTGGGGGTYDTTSLTNALLDAQLSSKVAALKKQNEAALANLAKTLSQTTSNLDTAAESIKSGFKSQKSAAAAQSDIGALNFAQQMAARGIRGNAAGLPDIYRNIGLQNALSTLGAQEASALSEIERQRALAENAYETDYTTLQNNLAYDLAAAGADTEAAKAQAQITALQQAQQRAEQLADQAKEDWSKYASGAYYNDYQAEINRIDQLMNQGQTVDSDGISLAYKKMLLTAARNEKLAALAEQAAKAVKASGGGGGGGGSVSSKNDTSSIVQNMLSLGSDVRAYDYLLSLGLSASLTNDVWNFYKTQKSTGGLSANYSAIYKQAGQMIANGASMDEVKDYIVGKVAAGGITTEEAKQIAAYLGIQ